MRYANYERGTRVWRCDYCERSGPDMAGLMPWEWTRFILPRNKWVDVCGECRDKAVEAMREVDIEPIRAISGQEYNDEVLEESRLQTKERFKGKVQGLI